MLAVWKDRLKGEWPVACCLQLVEVRGIEPRSLDWFA